ncbi:MAG: ParB/RepB/Spo0J family partition protein [Pseudomonadota bacterium]|nr:ParB/RepB/Spo0J family partition protein [Pseudomonadota bacterium]
MKPSKSAGDAPPRLGRGLAALLGGAETLAAATRTRGQQKIPIEFLRPNPRNPRRNFGEESLDELAASIKERGIIQPLLARPLAGIADAYEIIAGERRWRAAQRAGLHEVPIVSFEADDRQALELAIIENVQRADLDPLEEAAGYERLGDEFLYTQADLAKVIGKSRSHVSNCLRLLKLPERTKSLLREGKISAGHARVLLSSAEPDALAEKIVAQNLSVRDTEKLLEGASGNSSAKGQGPRRRGAGEKDADTRAMEKKLMEQLGMQVTITHRVGEAGEVVVRYKTFDQLEFLCRRLQGD